MSDFKIGHAQSYIGNQDTIPMPPAFPIQQTPVIHKLEGMDKLLELLERLVKALEAK